ncbi:MAG TPA: adenylate/guanylate cyclase domain-containing protein, partial [Candidatus Limnocylindrales bacterium]|nr:adenylate/guanylate cyclase domain-containing protein [Candidatus Limnocylindrales bacterium]
LAIELSRAADEGRAVELSCGTSTFSLLPVAVPGLGFSNVYGTDITARKVIDLFPGRNPYPVMRMTADGVLTYANPAALAVIGELGMTVGAPLPGDLLADLRKAFDEGEGRPVEISGNGRTYALHCVPIPELGFTNIYGSDVTAAKAITKFPDQNPHPVLRVAPDGRLLYANPAAALVLKGMGATVGEVLPAETLATVRRIAAAASGETIELESDGRLFSLLVVPVFEYGFTNLYGTDITAARDVERAHAENERLLLNILPASIAERLRQGEGVIADRVEEMTVLFADIVDFTQLSMRLTPAELIDLLNTIFSVFDELSDRYGLEKIKTIGDAYMVVGGLAPETGNHCGRVADVGLDMLDAVRDYREKTGVDLHVRIGMHVGPAVAGVVGLKKFIYDVWGETVNTASRMESHGVQDRIHVTSATYERLRDRYEFEPRGTIEVRNRGPMETYLMAGRRG